MDMHHARIARSVQKMKNILDGVQRKRIQKSAWEHATKASTGRSGVHHVNHVVIVVKKNINMKDNVKMQASQRKISVGKQLSARTQQMQVIILMI